jgi:integrase
MILGMKKPVLVVRPYRHHPKFKFILDLRAYGKGRLFFKTKAEADAERLRQQTLLERHSRAAVGLSQREMSDFITARETLAKYGKTINEATAFCVDHLERIRRCKVTVSQLKDELIAVKEKDGRAPRYIESLKGYLGKFARDFGDRLIAEITPEELDTWLRDLPYSPKSRLNFRQHIGVLFSHAKQRRMISENPIEFTARPKLVDKPPEIFTVDELSALLEAAQHTEPDIVPMLAIGAFAGLRESEIHQLSFDEINLARGHIEVKAAKAKSAKRRLVPIQPNLAAWLRPFSAMAGPVVPEFARGKLARVRKAAEITWKHNALRHSFASYRLAATNNAASVAAELGHSTAHLLYNAYRELVHPDEAARYWDIKPAPEKANVVAFSAPPRIKLPSASISAATQS